MALVTFVAGDILEAQQLNDSFAAVNVVKSVNKASVGTSQTTASGTYTDLATVGPAVTVTTGTRALVIITARLTCDTNSIPLMAYEVTGASSISPNDSLSIRINTVGANGQVANVTGIFDVVTLTPGSNVFTAKYRSVSSTNVTFSDRQLYVIPL